MSKPGRMASDLKRDQRSRPDIVIPMLELQPGDRVADIFAGGGYYSELLASVVGREGLAGRTGRLDPTVVSELITGCANACRDNGLALLGGETAEMPGLYADGDFEFIDEIRGGAIPSECIPATVGSIISSMTRSWTSRSITGAGE